MLTVYSGVISPGTLKEAVEATVDLGPERGTTRFLADCTPLEGGHSLVDLYGLAALVQPQLEAAARDVEFWETTCRDRRFDVRVFANVAKARAWLLEGRAAEA